MAKVVVMGAGLGGVACAYEMKKKLGKGHEVTMVGRSAFFEFTPSNPWIMVGWRTAPQTRVDLARPLANKDIRWVPTMVAAIDAPGSTLKLADGGSLAYDCLVITTGPKLAFEEIPGLGPRGYTQSVCTHEHALAAWECKSAHPRCLVALMANTIVISPELFIQKCKSLTGAKSLYVDAKDRQIRSAWTDNGSNKVEYIDRIEAVRLGIFYESLVDAVEERGGRSISMANIL